MTVARAALLFLCVAACGPNEDYTPQIRVAPGVAERGCLARLFPCPSDVVKVPAGAGAPPARVHALVSGEELGGPSAVGRPGDLVLSNDEVVFVIDKLGSGAGFAESGGNLVDAADARTKKDELGQVFSYFGTFPRQGVYDAITTGEAPDGSAFVLARGKELYDPSLEVTTRYSLRGGERGLLLETTVTNRGDHPSDKLSFGDAIQWGATEKFAPGKSVNFRGPSSGPFIGGVGRYVSYAVTSTEGEIEAVSGGSWTDTLQQKDRILAPGEAVTYARVFVVGQRADTSSLVGELTRLSGGTLGVLALTLLDETGKEIAAPDEAKAILSAAGGPDLMSLKKGPEGFEGEIVPGDYELAYASGGGRSGRGAKSKVHVIAGQVTRATLTVSAAASISLACNAEDPGAAATIPCKVTFEGVAATATPDFGPTHAAGPAKNQVTTATGKLDRLPIAPGRYRVTMSRGPEYDTPSSEIDVGAGKDEVYASVLHRVVDTKGYLATDFHQHTMLGTDSPVSTHDRVVSNVAEGVEVAVATEHNVVADFEPIVQELGLGAWMVALPGDELTSDASNKPWGHANVYPLKADPKDPRGGALPVRDRTARELFAELRKIPSPHVLQINHPRTGITGYFDQYKLDPATGEGTDPGYDPAFDALEVWNGRNVESRDRVLDDFFVLLRTKHPVTATADTDTHGIVGQEAGYPRTYVRVANDAHLETWDDARSLDLVKGVRELRDVVLTNGPFLRVTVNGAPIGGIARARGGDVTVKVHVECAPWIDVDSLQVSSASGGHAHPVAASAIKLKLDGKRMTADAVLHARFARDDAIVVIARGSKPMVPVLGGDPKEIVPYAMTGAVWVDADGDGRSLGR